MQKLIFSSNKALTLACESLYFVNNIPFFSLYYLIDFLISLFFYLPNFLLFLSFFHCSFYLNHPFLYWVDYFLPNIYSFSSSNKNFLFIFYALVNSFIFVWAILRLFCSLVISCSNSNSLIRSFLISYFPHIFSPNLLFLVQAFSVIWLAHNHFS